MHSRGADGRIAPSPARTAKPQDRGDGEDHGGVSRGERGALAAAVKGMKAIGGVGDPGGVAGMPRFRPVAAERPLHPVFQHRDDDEVGGNGQEDGLQAAALFHNPPHDHEEDRRRRRSTSVPRTARRPTPQVRPDRIVARGRNWPPADQGTGRRGARGLRSGSPRRRFGAEGSGSSRFPPRTAIAAAGRVLVASTFPDRIVRAKDEVFLPSQRRRGAAAIVIVTSCLAMGMGVCLAEAPCPTAGLPSSAAVR